MDTLEHILRKYDLDGSKRILEIPGTRYNTFPELFNELGFTKGAEIGVERGHYAKALASRMPELHLICVDPWKVYKSYREHVSQEKLDGFYEETVNRLHGYNCQIVREFSEDFSKEVADGSLDFVYIDANHSYLEVTKDIHFWWPKVRKGGILAGHDYRRNTGNYTNDVKDVVPSLAYAWKINPWFVLREPTEASSWFWVKQ